MPIKVLLVDDSPMVLHFLRKLLESSEDIVVVGTAAQGQQALDLLQTLKPDVICTDMHMPVMDGLALTRAVMAASPCPILVVSVSVEPGSANVFQLLEAGAVDIYPKPRNILEADNDRLAKELTSKIRVLAGVKVYRRSLAASEAKPAAPQATLIPRPHLAAQIVVVGASTGGPQALFSLLAGLPRRFPVPIVCVQHIGSDFLGNLMAWLQTGSALPLQRAVQGVLPLPGVVYFAPEDLQLEFDAQRRFQLLQAPPCDGHCPSVTVAMRSAAQRFGPTTIGVLLTGMGRDGADGMASIASAGGVTVAQDEASSVVYGMPKEAVKLGAVQFSLPLEQIAAALLALTDKRETGVQGARPCGEDAHG